MTEPGLVAHGAFLRTLNSATDLTGFNAVFSRVIVRRVGRRSRPRRRDRVPEQAAEHRDFQRAQRPAPASEPDHRPLPQRRRRRSRASGRSGTTRGSTGDVLYATSLGRRLDAADPRPARGGHRGAVERRVRRRRDRRRAGRRQGGERPLPRLRGHVADGEPCELGRHPLVGRRHRLVRLPEHRLLRPGRRRRRQRRRVEQEGPARAGRPAGADRIDADHDHPDRAAARERLVHGRGDVAISPSAGTTYSLDGAAFQDYTGVVQRHGRRHAHRAGEGAGRVDERR